MTKEEYVRQRMQSESAEARLVGTMVKWIREDMREGKIDVGKMQEEERFALKIHRVMRGPDITF